MANLDLVNAQGNVRNDSLPGFTIDGNWAPQRISSYGEQFLHTIWGQKNHALTDEGTYFSFCNPTAGTAIADGNASGFVTTTPLLVIANTNGGTPVTGGKSLYLDYLNLIVTTAAGTSSTNFVAAMYLDTGNRYSSGGSAITPNNTNMNGSNATGAVINFGAVTAKAANTQRQIYNQILRTVIPVIGDNYQFRFGETSPAAAGMPLEGTLQVERIIQVPPIVIPPGCSFLLYTWGASQGTARQHTFTGGFWER